MRAQGQERKLSPTAKAPCQFGYVEFFTEAPERCLFLQRILLEVDSKFAAQVTRILFPPGCEFPPDGASYPGQPFGREPAVPGESLVGPIGSYP
jgi:hypothetical protein